MRRIRGRRVLLLLASALPLLAVDDVPQSQNEQRTATNETTTAVNEESSHQPVLGNEFSRPLAPDTVLPALPVDWSTEFDPHYNIVIPFRPSYAEKWLSNETTQRRRKKRQTASEAAQLSRNETESPELNATNTTEEEIKDENATITSSEEDKEADLQERVVIDYASKSAGALILEKSANWKGTSNLLNADKDKYAIIPCEESNKWVVISLSEDILVKKIVLANYERYSSHVKEFNVLGSQTMGNWADLGNFTAQPGNGKQTFDLAQPSWARYLKFRFQSHYGDEHYCTVSQISAHGSTMLQGFHEQWEEDESKQGDDDESTEGDGSELQEGSQEASKESPPLINQCFTKLNAMCPADMSFERSLFLFGSEDVSDFEVLSAISSASICLSSSQSVKSNSSYWGSHHELNRVAIVNPPSKSGDAESLVANTSKREETHDPLTDSTVVKQIKNMIKSTGIDVNLENIGDGLLRAHQEGEEEKKDSKEEKEVATEKPSQEPSKEDKQPTEEVQKTEASTLTPKDTPPHIEEKPTEAKTATPQTEESSHESLKSTGLALAKVLERLPSVSCLEKLDFPAFKSSRLNARNNGPGAGGGGPTGSGMEPIFKKLTDEIKMLQASVSVHDQFTRESVACYQRVLLDLLVEIESMRADHGERIEKIENDMQNRCHWIFVLSKVFAPLYMVTAPIVRLLVKFSLLEEESLFIDWIRMAVAVLLGLFLCHCVATCVTGRGPHLLSKAPSSPTTMLSGSTDVGSHWHLKISTRWSSNPENIPPREERKSKENGENEADTLNTGPPPLSRECVASLGGDGKITCSTSCPALITTYEDAK